ncbi:Cof-type HAD-IIB family hydrolase [Mycoplasmopsis gallopavonis]|uniref:COF family HAD hydrolase protein n=1 Tax=Mycoplasmopsis gallopavonis TaxID=76629 RepID=A0A449B057_9BACT|nr:Cof-type HAD-IIB family hydrolase [Mycoplasmopsis gallopavonis]RIV16320.1 Cof-type HAD-IIB family hydrolase [Mycoplasmopsis gallopavonis]VEU73106.1 COF family HAD hydrolase protein [Mycoplasmopsis gallopavonis]
MNKWAIFSDVDGTIYGFPHKKLADETKHKMAEIAAKGVPFVINTGNGPYQKIQRLADELNGRYVICSNGALIWDNQDKKILNLEILPLEEAKKIWRLAEKAGVGLYYFGTHQYYLHMYTEEFKNFITEFCEYDEWILDGRLNEDMHKIEAYGDPQKLEYFYKLTQEEGVNLNVCNLKTHIEITKTGVSKGSGIKWLCENVFNTSVENVMAIGDSPNDISMFEVVGYSYAMENADDLTRSYAKYYTSSVDQLGLVEAVNDYLYRSDFELKRAISQQGKK